jgi:hypothetical protein
MAYQLVSIYSKFMLFLVAISAAIPISSGLSVLFLEITRLKPYGYVASTASLVIAVTLVCVFSWCLKNSLHPYTVQNTNTKVVWIVNFRFLVFGTLNLLLMAISAFDVNKVKFARANDGPNHIEILRGIEESNVLRINPLLVTAEGNVTETFSPYPIGSHLLVAQFGKLAHLDAQSVYQFFAVFFVAVGFPVAIGFISWVASGRAPDWFLIGTFIGICGKPNEKYLQLPTLMSLAAAFILGAIFCLINNKNLAFVVLHFSAFSLLIIHPSGMASCYLIYLIIGNRLKVKVYVLGLISVAIFALLSGRMLRTEGYFNVWISSNINPDKEQYKNSLFERGFDFTMNYVMGLGNSNVALGCACVLAIALLIVKSEDKAISFQLIPVLIMLVSSAFSGISSVGKLFAFLTFPWYGSPQRFVLNWTAVLAISTAQLSHLSLSSFANNRFQRLRANE